MISLGPVLYSDLICKTLKNIFGRQSKVKPAYVVISIKQSPVLKGHIFFIVIENFI
jgi:hypothetical protein